MLRQAYGKLHRVPYCNVGRTCTHRRAAHSTRAHLNSTRVNIASLAGIATAFTLFLPVIYNDSEALDTADKSSPRHFVNETFDDALKTWTIRYGHASEYGVAEIFGASLPSNSPSEDRSAIQLVRISPTLEFLLFGVFDGHSGGRTAEKLSQDLFPYLSLRLADLYSKFATDSSRDPGEPPDPEVPWDDLHTVIKSAFVEFDNILVHEPAQRALGLSEADYDTLNRSKQTDTPNDSASSTSTSKPTRGEGFRMLAEAYSGSCAIVGIYNRYQRSLHVALTGDSRAVLGRRVLINKAVPAGKGKASESPDHSPQSPPPPVQQHVYEVFELSEDQTAKNPKEAERLKAQHPEEPELLKNKRVVGWGPARAFGDGVMKWSRAVQQRLWKEYMGDRPRSEDVYKTPPYFTAEPEITTFESAQKGDFVVMASDGLWDCLTSEEVVGLVGKWLDERQTRTQGTDIALSGSDKTRSISYQPSELPVDFPADYQDTTVMYRYWRAPTKRFISDPTDRENVAHHLIRNALGGADQDLTETLHWMEGSRRRRFKDDITIQIIIFE